MQIGTFDGAELTQDTRERLCVRHRARSEHAVAFTASLDDFPALARVCTGEKEALVLPLESTGWRRGAIWLAPPEADSAVRIFGCWIRSLR